MMISDDTQDNDSQQLDVQEDECQLEKVIINRKRENFSIQMRNSKKKQFLSNNRIKMYQKYQREMVNDNIDDKEPTIKSFIPEHILTNQTLIELFLKDFENYDPSDIRLLYKGLNQLRQLSSIEQSNYVMVLISQSNIHPILVQLISNNIDPKLRYEAAWLLTNCIVFDYKSIAVRLGNDLNSIFDAFINLYQESNNDCLFEVGIWGLTNLMVEVQIAAEIFKEKCGFQDLQEKLKIYQNDKKIQELLAWMITVLSEYYQIFSKEDILLFFKIVEKFVMQNTNLTIQNFGIRVFYKLVNDDNFCIAITKKSNLIDYLLSLTNNSEYTSYIIGIMGGITACDKENVTKILLEHNILEYLSITLDNVKVNVRKEAMWCISNVLSGDEEDIQYVIDYNRLLEKIFKLGKTGQIQIVQEVCHGLTNCLSKANKHQIMKLYQFGILEIFVQFFVSKDINITSKALQGMEFLLEFGCRIGNPNPIKISLETQGFEEILESLKLHKNKQVRMQADGIYEQYFKKQVEEGDEEYKNEQEDQQQQQMDDDFEI